MCSDFFVVLKRKEVRKRHKARKNQENGIINNSKNATHSKFKDAGASWYIVTAQR